MTNDLISIDIYRHHDGADELVRHIEPGGPVKLPIIASNFTNLLRSTNDPRCFVVVTRQDDRTVLARLSGSELSW